MTPAGYDHGRIAGNIFGLMWTHVRREKLGVVFAAETGFVLQRDPDTVRAPDVSFVRSARARASEPGFFPGPPDLAVEVVSPQDRVQEVEDKVQAWLDAGTSIVWVVWPTTRSVSVHGPGGEVSTATGAERVEGGAVIPGLGITVTDIFE